MQGLKALVIFMGVLIVIGLGGLAYGIVQKVGGNSEMKSESAMPVETVSVVVPSQNFGNVDALLPQGSSIIEVIPSGNLLTILIEREDGGRALKIIDIANGNDKGTIHLDPPMQTGEGAQ